MVNWLRALLTPAPGVQLPAEAIPAPWPAGRRAIHDLITECRVQGDGSLPNPTFALPGEKQDAPACDGAADYSTGYTPTALERAQTHALSKALLGAADDHAPPRLARMYVLLQAAPAAAIGEDMLARLHKSGADPARMALLARWLARSAPDAIAVKLAITLLGQYGNASDADMLMTLGLHEEFTLLCALALCKLLGPEPSQTAMWNLARRVHGWGRIHVVRKLSNTQCPEVQQWLLREGYKNTHTNACLAGLCASGGKLLAALRSPVPDERLLIGAGEILAALLMARDQPARSMADYADGAAATLAYLQAVQRQRPPQLQVAASVIEIADSGNPGWIDAEWRHVAHLARQVLAMDYWPILVQDKLRTGSDEEFEVAAAVAARFQVDPWDFQFAKQQRRERPQWCALTDATDPARVDRYVALALEQLDLAALAVVKGADGAQDVETQGALNWLAIGLRKFPGKGWPLLRAALAGGHWDNKGNAVDTLEHWRSAHWHAEAIAALDRAWRIETNPDLKQQMEQLLQKLPAAHATARSGT